MEEAFLLLLAIFLVAKAKLSGNYAKAKSSTRYGDGPVICIGAAYL
ncbi:MULTISPECIES: hypothetical protein [unclassified Lysinibacillus]|nr:MULTISPECIES: hypothetical protein [unclassified Lysinibacillus]